jgi:hypothetical protein
MDGERLDLSPLRSGPDADREDRLVGAIMRRAAPELTRRASRAGVLGMLGNWMWPTLAAAAVAALISGTVLARVQSDTDDVGGLLLGGVVPALGLAEPVSAWLDEGRAPHVSDVVLALEGDPR